METNINKLPEDINYMFYIKPKGAKRFSTYNPGQGTMGTGRVFTELYRKEHLQKVCDWIAEDMSGDWIYQLRSGDGKKIYWQHDPTQPAQPTETPRISTETAETVNVSVEGENAKNEPIKHISEVLKEAEQSYQCVKSETLHTVREADGKWHTYFMGDEIGIDLAYGQINHIPAARTAQAAEEVAEIRRYINRLDGNHIADADFYLAEMREGIKQAEAARRKSLVLSSREDVLAHLDKLHGLEYDAGEVAYFKDGCTAEEHEDGTVWRVYPDTESDEVIGTYRIAPQSLEAPPTAKHPTPPPILGRRRRKRARRGAQAAPGLRSAPGMHAGGCGASRPAGRREAPVTSLRGSVGISGMVHGGSFYRSALPRAGPPYTENQVLPLQNNFD